MIRYFLVLDISSKEEVISYPQKYQVRYENFVSQTMKKKKLKQLGLKTHGKQVFPSKDIFFFQKMDKNYMYGVVCKSIDNDSDLIYLFEDFYQAMEKIVVYSGNNKFISTWLKTEIEKYNRGERRLEDRMRNASFRRLSKKLIPRVSEANKKTLGVGESGKLKFSEYQKEEDTPDVFRPVERKILRDNQPVQGEVFDETGLYREEMKLSQEFSVVSEPYSPSNKQHIPKIIVSEPVSPNKQTITSQSDKEVGEDDSQKLNLTNQAGLGFKQKRTTSDLLSRNTKNKELFIIDESLEGSRRSQKSIPLSNQQCSNILCFLIGNITGFMMGVSFCFFYRYV